MKLAALFSGGKDSTLAAYMAKQAGHELACLISLKSENEHSFMFHTPSISATQQQAKAMNIPLIEQLTKGKKETELRDLEVAINQAIKQYKIDGIVTGAVESVYQATRIQNICNKLNLEVFNPLWQKPQLELLNDLIENKFKVIVTGIAAYPLDMKWLGREINQKFISDIKVLSEKYKINPAGEGGEFESFVLDCPLFRKPLKIKSYKDVKEGGNSGRREVDII